MNSTPERDTLGNRVSVLLGAGRSGTTLLYKILSMHRDVAYVSNYVQKVPSVPSLAFANRLLHRLPSIKRRTWFLEEGGAYMNSKRIRVHAVVPTPFEGEAIYRHCGVPLTPVAGAVPGLEVVTRLRSAFAVMLGAAGGDTLLTKRTANNRRVAWLDAAFPKARYIHLVRDGRAVAYSLLRVNWWDDHTLFWAGQTPRQMTAGGADPMELAARNWVQEIAEIEAGLAILDQSQVLQMRYEDLLTDPVRQVERALDFLGVSMDADPAFRQLLEGLNLRPAPESWRKRWSESERGIVQNLQASTLQRWGYLVDAPTTA